MVTNLPVGKYSKQNRVETRADKEMNGRIVNVKGISNRFIVVKLVLDKGIIN